jgi:hypothetical protein
MFTTYIQIGADCLGNFYAVAQNEDKTAAVNETISRANEIFTDEFLAAKKPYKVMVCYPDGTRKFRTINK